jgi:hypothetical protein
MQVGTPPPNAPATYRPMAGLGAGRQLPSLPSPYGRLVQQAGLPQLARPTVNTSYQAAAQPAFQAPALTPYQPGQGSMFAPPPPPAPKPPSSLPFGIPSEKALKNMDMYLRNNPNADIGWMPEWYTLARGGWGGGGWGRGGGGNGTGPSNSSSGGIGGASGQAGRGGADIGGAGSGIY